MRIVDEPKLDFKDVLIRPRSSALDSRKDVVLHRSFNFRRGFSLEDIIPIIASNMDGVGTISMAQSLSRYDMLTSLVKHYDVEKLIPFMKSEAFNETFYTLGPSAKDFDKLRSLIDEVQAYPPLVCLDAANGYTAEFIKKVYDLRKLSFKSIIMAGNVATPDMATEIIYNGADIVKVGIGPGKVCTTREVTGVGYPQLSAIIECAEAVHSISGHICADGGCSTPGDIAKAFAAGADFVMLGYMLSGTECGEIARGEGFASLYGSSSANYQCIHNDGVPSYATAEGTAITIPLHALATKVKHILGGLRSTCTYVGAATLEELHNQAVFVKVSS